MHDFSKSTIRITHVIVTNSKIKKLLCGRAGVLPPPSFWCWFLAHLLGGVVVVLLVAFFSPSLWCCFLFLLFVLSGLSVSLVRGGLSLFFERQLHGANELNQVAMKHSEANESKVVFF